METKTAEEFRAEEWRRLDRVAEEVEAAVRRAVTAVQRREALDAEVLVELGDEYHVGVILDTFGEGRNPAESCVETELGRLLAQWRLWRVMGEPTSEELDVPGIRSWFG